MEEIANGGYNSSSHSYITVKMQMSNLWLTWNCCCLNCASLWDREVIFWRDQNVNMKKGVSDKHSCGITRDEREKVVFLWISKPTNWSDLSPSSWMVTVLYLLNLWFITRICVQHTHEKRAWMQKERNGFRYPGVQPTGLKTLPPSQREQDVLD